MIQQNQKKKKKKGKEVKRSVRVPFFLVDASIQYQKIKKDVSPLFLR